MADIQKSIRLFNEALPLALAKLDDISIEDRRRISSRLSEVVRTSIRAGLEDPAAIATAAVEAFKSSAVR
jgi:hypothetical protein